jgi:hypothetical protein
MNQKEKERLIEKYKAEGQSLEGLDSCLHGQMLYETCHPCGREIAIDILDCPECDGKLEIEYVISPTFFVAKCNKCGENYDIKVKKIR